MRCPLFEFCRRSIKNVRDPASGLTAEDRAALNPNKQASDDLKQGAGTSLDIDLLFASLATPGTKRASRGWASAGYMVRPQLCRSLFSGHVYAAVRVGDQWRFSDPASKQAPYGMLRPQEEGGPFRDRRRYGEFLFVRSVEMRAAAIQPGEYGRLRDFYGRVQAADPSAVVLVKQ